jgi:hypothetical protein
VQVWRAPHDNLAAWVKINEIIVPDGSGPQTAHGAIAEELVNLGDNSYTVVAAGTSITQGINSVRVGYRPAPTVVPISPIARVLDTRAGAKLAAGSDTLVNLGLPAAAQSAILTLTVTETTGSSGYIGVYPGNVATWPGNSNINWFDAGQNLATGVTTAVSSTGTIKLHVGENATHVIVDVQGYLA